MEATHMNSQEEVYVYGGKTFTVPALRRDGGVVLLPRLAAERERRPGRPSLAEVAARVRTPPPPRPPPDEAELPRWRWPTALEALARLNRTWDVSEFETVHPPLIIDSLLSQARQGEAEEEEGSDEGGFRDLLERPGAFSPRHQRVLDMPIKFPGSHEYRLPAELKALAPLVQRVIDFEYAMNDLTLDSYCYLTLDQGVVPPGQMQRNEGCHTDGFQGARISPKLRTDHSYIVSNTLPTVFYLQPFEVKHLDPARHNFFLDFDRQVKEEHAWRPEPYDIVLMDAFCCHRGEKATQDTFRTFVRLSYTLRIFDRLGNAHNPMFDYQWEMVPRQTQSTLQTYIPTSTSTSDPQGTKKLT